MRRTIPLIVLMLLVAAAPRAGAAELNVVTTLTDYAFLAERIGGDRVSVQAIVRGDQDAHFIRPKPSFVNLVRKADVLIDTGLDLEMWLPTVVDKSGNQRVRSGQPGYVAAARGMHLLEVPQVVSRVEGGVHLYGNPHVTTSPLNLRVAARNIATGFITNDPEGRAVYEANLEALLREIDERLFGAELVDLVGGQTLCDLADEGRLMTYLELETVEGEPLLPRLGGWMKRLLPLRGVPIVTYHKNWVYFVTLFGIDEVGTIEPKPGIPPSTKHVAELVELMKTRHIGIILASNYFDEAKVRGVAEKVGAVPVIVPLYVGGAPGADTTFALFDLWVDSLLSAAHQSGVLGS
jgi:zinc/manganese transport system substrate-binding protein